MFSVSRLILSAPRFQYIASAAPQTKGVKKVVMRWQKEAKAETPPQIGDGDYIKIDVTKVDLEKTKKTILLSRIPAQKK